MYELKLERLNVSALVFPEPQSVLVAVILVLMPTLMICYAYPSICELCHSFNPYRHLCASCGSDPRPPHSPEHHRPIPEHDADSERHDLLTKDSAPHPPEDATVATSLEHNEVPSSPECVAPKECHEVLSGAPAPEDEAPRSVDASPLEHERSPEESTMPLTDDTDGFAGISRPANEIAGAAETAGSAPYDTPSIHPEAAEISPEESELSEPTQTEVVELVESAIIPDEAEDESPEPIGSAVAPILPHPPEEVTSSSEASHSASVPPFDGDGALSVSASLTETSVQEDESTEPQPELDAEVDADDATESHAHIMQSAFLVDGPDDSGEHPSESILSQSGYCPGAPPDEVDDEDGDAEWTSVDRAEGRTPRATTLVEATASAVLPGPASASGKSAVSSLPPHSGDLDVAVAGSIVLLTESEYLQFKVENPRAQAEPAEREAEEADSTITSTVASTSTTRTKHTPAPLDLTEDVHPGQNCSQRQSTASPSRDPSALCHGSPTSPATPGRRVHTPDRPDWAVAPSSSDADGAAPKKARRHSCDHPDWAVAPDGDRDPEGASTPSKRKGRKSDSDSATSSVAGLGGAALLSGSGSGRGRGRGKRRKHRGRHSR